MPLPVYRYIASRDVAEINSSLLDVQNVHSLDCGWFSILFLYYCMHGTGPGGVYRMFKNNSTVDNDDVLQEVMERLID